MPDAYFVTGATGVQGGAVARQLLAAGQMVHALARDPTGPEALALEAAGAKVFSGSFSDTQAMTTAATGCVGAFLNPSPVFTDPMGERTHVANMLAAARACGVRRVVLSTVSTMEPWTAGRYVLPPEAEAFRFYYEGKAGCEELVRKDPNLEHWAIVRPPRLLNSYVGRAAAFMFPTMRSEATLATAIRPDMTVTVLDPLDVGKATAEIFLRGRHWGKAVSLGKENLTVEQIVAAFNASLGGQKLKLRFVTEDEAKALGSSNPIFISELIINKNSNVVSDEARGEFDFEWSPAEAYFKREIDAVKAAIGEA